MPLPRHPGLSGSRVVPDGWAAHHAFVVDRTLDCTVDIGPATGPAVFGTETRRMAAETVTPVYSGPASVGLASVGGSAESARVDVADEQVDIRAYLIKLPADTADAVEIDHVVTVTAAPSLALIGQRLVVTGVGRPGREFSRVITARLYE